MKNTHTPVTRAICALGTVKQAVSAARCAQRLLEEDPAAGEFAEAAYRLCLAAQHTCEQAADGLDPENPDHLAYHRKALAAAEEAAGYADTLAALAAKAGHIIRR